MKNSELKNLSKRKAEFLKGLHECELNILKEVTRVCKKLNIKYYLDGGTMLGAIRHQGFIPWDDDIDVFMLREDYERFLIEAPKHLNKKYFLQTYNSDKNYLNSFAKMRNSETTFIEKTVKKVNSNHGVYIDIFVYDNYNPVLSVNNTILNLLLKWYNLKLYKYYCVSTRKRKIKSAISKTLFFYFKSITKQLIKKDKIIQYYKNKPCKYVRSYSSTYSLERAIFKKEWLGKGKLVKFEDIEAYVPENYDMWLKTIYGDYMKLPPKEKRKPHHDCEMIDLNKSYLEYKKGK